MNARAARAIGASRVGHRGVSLLSFGALSLLYGFGALAFPSSEVTASATSRYFATLLPLRAWAVLWVVTGVVCVYHAFQRYDRFGYIAAVGMFMLWGLLTALGVWFADVPATGVAIWLVLAGKVWAESIRPEAVEFVPLDLGTKEPPDAP